MKPKIRQRVRRGVFLVASVLVCLPQAARATSVTITAGNHMLAPNMGGKISTSSSRPTRTTPAPTCGRPLPPEGR